MAAFSLEAWVRFDAVDGVYRHVFNKDANVGPGRQQFGIYLQQGSGLAFERYVDGTEKFVRAPAPSAGSFHHVVGTYDGSTLTLYVDGASRGTVEDSRSQAAKSTPLFIGLKEDGGDVWGGAIDEAAIYDKALTSTQVAQHHLAGLR